MTPLACIAPGMLGRVFVTAPVGPVNVTIMQRAYRYGFARGDRRGVREPLADVLLVGFGALIPARLPVT